MTSVKSGRPVAAIGAPGGRRIISAVVQVVLNLIERKMSAEEAIDAPRIDASGSSLLASDRLSDVVAKLNMPVRLVAEEHQPFGYELARPVMVARDAETISAN